MVFFKYDYSSASRLQLLICSVVTVMCDIVCQEYQAVVDAEWSILYNKLDKIHQSGAKVVLSKLPIGDVATQFFADRFTWHFSVN